jgi:ATP-dependent RNA helicase DOB1
MEDKILNNPLHTDPRLPELYELYMKKRESQDTIRVLKKRIQATHDVIQLKG